MPFSGDMSLLNTIYTSVINNYSKFVKEIYLYLAATFITFSGDKSPIIVTFSGDNKVAAKDPIQAQNLSGEFLATTFRRKILLTATLDIFSGNG